MQDLQWKIEFSLWATKLLVGVICSNGTCLVRISDLFRPNDELTHSIQQDAVFLVIF